MTDMPDDSPRETAARPAPAASLLPSLGEWPARDAQSAALKAALLDTARVLQALHERFADDRGELRDMLGRCDALLARATEAARAQRAYVAWDCLQQIERERVLAMSEDERRAEMALALAESRTLLSGWRQDAAEGLAAGARGPVKGA